jgi:hypothetical protein
MKKYEIGKSYNDTIYNDWFAQCKKQQIPYITITKKIKYSTIRWDYISFKKDFDSKVLADEESHRANLTNFVKVYSSPKSKFQFDNFNFEISNIEHIQATKLAEELFDYLYNFYNKS